MSATGVALPGWPWAPVLRAGRGGHPVAHVDAGDGPPVVLVHGQPTWGYLWRRVLPGLLDAGARCVVPDHLGFGRSSKPRDDDAYSFAVHAGNVADLLDELDLRDATMVVHDWGGPIGLRAALERPDRVARLVLMDTGLLSGRQRMGPAWLAFREWVRVTPEIDVGALVAAGCRSPLDPAVQAAYGAPFAGGAADQTGVHRFPELVPTDTEHPEAGDHQRVWDALTADSRPALTLWAGHDLVFPVEQGRRFLARVGLPEPVIVPGAGHFLQEDAGEAVAAHVVAWLRAEGALT
jgi:haloalkane dehalogenase